MPRFDIFPLWIPALHIALALLALRYIWRKSADAPGMKIFWSLVCVFGFMIGPLLAFGFARILPTHGDARPPARHGGGDQNWRNG